MVSLTDGLPLTDPPGPSVDQVARHAPNSGRLHTQNACEKSRRLLERYAEMRRFDQSADGLGL